MKWGIAIILLFIVILLAYCCSTEPYEETQRGIEPYEETETQRGIGPYEETETQRGIGPDGQIITCEHKTFEYDNQTYCNLQPCESNRNCLNDACGRLTAADNAQKICCPSGNTHNYGLLDYCTEMVDGSICFSDAMCKEGSECVKPSVSMVNTNSSSTQMQCSDEYNTSVCGTYAVLNGLAEAIGSITKKGICVNKQKNPGNICTSNPDDSDGCKYGCGYTSMDNLGNPVGNTVCCDVDQYTVQNVNDTYCAPFKTGSHCESDKFCGTGSYCTDCGLLSCSKDSVCKKQKNINEECDESKECLNELCARRTAADHAPKICCPYETAIGVDTFAGYDYCKRMEDGETCYSNSMCESGTCEGGSIFGKGKCASSCGGQKCPAESTCISQIKSDGTNFSTCCPAEQVGEGINGKMMCCATGSAYDIVNQVCRPTCGGKLCKSGEEHCVDNVCVKNV
jgi:hypothetical protein